MNEDRLQDQLSHKRVSPPIGPRLRIAQVAPLYETVPPKLYGGTERVVAYLTEALVARGHDVTLYASGDSTCRARLRPGWPIALRLAGLSTLGSAYQLAMLGEVYEHADEFDLIHSHVDFWSFPFSRMVATPSIVTIHGRLDLPDLAPLYRKFRDMRVASISDAQREPLPDLNWVGTVHHGLPRDLLQFNPGPGKYLGFLGRISPEKRPDLAIEVARRVGIPLKIAAKVDAVDHVYFEEVIKPLLSTPGVEYIGEIQESEKSEFLGNALALLFTIDWPEPFGLVMIESLACGTPVITRPCGSIPEIIRHGTTGFIGSTMEEIVQAVRKVESLSRTRCRAEFEARFTSDIMAANYERLYADALLPRRAADRPWRRLAPKAGLAASVFSTALGFGPRRDGLKHDA